MIAKDLRVSAPVGAAVGAHVERGRSAGSAVAGGRRRRPGRARHSSRSWRRSWAKGPAAHGWEDQRWTPERVKTVTGRPFHLAYTIQGVHKLLVRNGWSCQVPARRAVARTAASPRPA
ncbi:winged helix-turn-helix domain-containing protein [Streptomyces sp. NPDC059153]|uniref:helix-turn-helix domain-containing protein n=1 Tax=Streptomyces sp. NPDC059153 TaxID=3346743 RepID=UPI0036A63E46